MSHSTPSTCPQCGAEFHAEETGSLCPACLLAEAMKPTGPRGPWEPPSAEELGAMLPQYEVERLLGRGGMGAVYKGRQPELDRHVAIKILPPDADGGGHDFAARFKIEARAMARLKHPGIVTVHDFGQTAGGLLYFVMEFVEGMDVQAMIIHQGRISSADAVAIAVHVCDALHYAHDHGIIHRDIKPANVMLGNDGHVRVADFGLAKMMDAAQSSHLTLSGNVMGTPNYLAPECLTLGMTVDHRADVYAVGVMLYHMLTGRVPRGVFEPAATLVPGLDPRLDAIIRQAMREDRELRYQSAEALRSDLADVLTQPVAQTIIAAKKAGAPAGARHTAAAAAPVAEWQDEEDAGLDPAVEAMLRSTSSLNHTMLILGLLAIGLIGGLAVFLAMRRTGDVHNITQTITTTVTNNSYFTQLIASGRTSLEDLAALEIRPLGDSFAGITRSRQTWTQAVQLAEKTGSEVFALDATQSSEVEQIETWLTGTQPPPQALWVRQGDQPALYAAKSVSTATSPEAEYPALLIWKPEKVVSASKVTASPPLPVSASPSAPVSSSSNPPSWTDITGRRIQAAFIRLEGEGVVLRMEGQDFIIPFTRLSPPSIEQARQLGAAGK